MSQNTPRYRKILREFILIYKSEPCLWQIKNELYHNRAVKNAALDKLVKKYKEIDRKADRVAVSRKINALRTTYKREKRKVDASKRYGDTYEPKLWYYKMISFVDNRDAPVTSSLTLKDEEGEDVVEKEYMDVMNDQDLQSNSGDDMSSSDDNLQTNELSDRPSSGPKPKRRCENRNSVSRSINDNFKRPRDESTIEDRHDVYCKYVACRLRDLPRQQVILAERLINDVLFQAECSNLTLGYKVVNTEPVDGQYSPSPSSHQIISPASRTSHQPNLTAADPLKKADSNSN